MTNWLTPKRPATGPHAWLSTLLIFIASASIAGAVELVEQIVVVANANSSNSLALAHHYLEARGIPAKRLCELNVPDEENISRETYEQAIREPLLDFLRRGKFIEQIRRNPVEISPHESGWTTISTSIRYVALFYGMPLRIEDTRPALIAAAADHLRGVINKDAAALDSEMALLLYPGYPIKGPYSNPLYNQINAGDFGAGGQPFLVVTRLDGPDPATVARMIDDSIQAERYGLQGRGYFDGRGFGNSSYDLGEHWIREAGERFKREGYECLQDEADPVWGSAFPMENAAVYMGWYAPTVIGPFTRTGFTFQPGALAYHLHSSSAVTLHSRSEYWAGPLLADGAAATMGAVSEPYLTLTPNLNTFADRICDGFTFGESAYMSLASVSWQITVVGDPLYRPFRYGLDEQIKALEADHRPEIEWAYLRKVNRLVHEERFNVALDYCRDKINQTDSLVLREKLGDLYGKNNLFKEAGEQYRYILGKTASPETAVRVGARWVLMLRVTGQTNEATQVETDLRVRWKDSTVLPWLETSKLN